MSPFRVFLYAGGFSEDHNIVIGESAPVWFDPQAPDEAALWDSFDALSTFGVRMLRPDSGEWIEISVRGRPHVLRTAQSEIGPPLGPPYSNELVDGTIVDICGVSFIYQSPVTMAANLKQQVAFDFVFIITSPMSSIINFAVLASVTLQLHPSLFSTFCFPFRWLPRPSSRASTTSAPSARCCCPPSPSRT